MTSFATSARPNSVGHKQPKRPSSKPIKKDEKTEEDITPDKLIIESLNVRIQNLEAKCALVDDLQR